MSGSRSASSNRQRSRSRAALYRGGIADQYDRQEHRVAMETRSQAIQTLRAPHLVVDDFLPAEVAAELRADIERHFANLGRHDPATHQVWNYWFVPGLYTYLRTQPEKILQRANVQLFMDVL